MASRTPLAVRQCLRQSRSSIPSRTFTSSCQRRRNGPLAVFPPTSSLELDTLLTAFHANVFFPAHLTRAYRQLVYRRTLQQHITGEEPVSVELPTTASAGEKVPFTLYPLDHLRDEPNTRKSFAKLLDLLRERKDWELLPDFLRELKASGRRLRAPLVAKMVRKAAGQGHMGLMMEVFRRVESTGLKLGDLEVTREVMQGAIQRAVRGDWGEQELDKALKHAELTLLSLEDPKHAAGKGQENPLDRPEVIGVAMALAATKAAKYLGAKDEGGKVERYASRYLKSMEGKEISVDATSWRDGNDKLTMWVPSWQGIQMALKVLGKDSQSAKGLSEVLARDLEPLIGMARSVVEAHPAPEEGRRRGIAMYEDLARTLA